MGNFGLKEDILKEIEVLFKKMNTGKLSVEELDELVMLTRELNERSVILRYKAFEEKVFGALEEPKHEPVVKEVLETPQAVTAEEPVAVKQVNTDGQPVFDFSLFEEPIEEEKEEEQVIEQKVETPAPTSTPEPVVENVEVVEPQKPITQTEVKVEESVTVETNSSGDVNVFVRKFTEVNNSMETHLALSKIETLVGSFGLNERLQYINELFDGSSEKFGDAVKKLDHLNSRDEAFVTASQLALENDWDKDSETVAEFIQKLSRRYA